MKKRYQITNTGKKNWIRIDDLKKERFFWMHITDFGITHQELPAYCRTEARAIIITHKEK